MSEDYQSPYDAEIERRQQNVIECVPAVESAEQREFREVARDSAFRAGLEELINRHSRENGSNTPDFILAQFLFGCLYYFDEAVNRRTDWYGPKAQQSVQLPEQPAALSDTTSTKVVGCPSCAGTGIKHPLPHFKAENCAVCDGKGSIVMIKTAEERQQCLPQAHRSSG